MMCDSSLGVGDMVHWSSINIGVQQARRSTLNADTRFMAAWWSLQTAVSLSDGSC